MAPSYVGTCNSAAALILFYTQTVMVVVVFLNIQINERVKFLIINFISTFLYKISFRNQHACTTLQHDGFVEYFAQQPQSIVHI